MRKRGRTHCGSMGQTWKRWHLSWLFRRTRRWIICDCWSFCRILRRILCRSRGRSFRRALRRGRGWLKRRRKSLCTFRIRRPFFSRLLSWFRSRFTRGWFPRRFLRCRLLRWGHCFPCRGWRRRLVRWFVSRRARWRLCWTSRWITCRRLSWFAAWAYCWCRRWNTTGTIRRLGSWLLSFIIRTLRIISLLIFICLSFCCSIVLLLLILILFGCAWSFSRWGIRRRPSWATRRWNASWKQGRGCGRFGGG